MGSRLVVASLVAVAGCQFKGGATGGEGAHLLTGTITEISGEYGNLETDITVAAVGDAGLRAGTRFQFSCRGRAYAVTFGETYSDVGEGDWIGFINWAENLRLARNLANAAETSGCGVGDAVEVRTRGAR